MWISTDFLLLYWRFFSQGWLVETKEIWTVDAAITQPQGCGEVKSHTVWLFIINQLTIPTF